MGIAVAHDRPGAGVEKKTSTSGSTLHFDLDFGVERQELIRRLQRGDAKQRDIHHIHHVHLLLLRRPDRQFLVGHRDVGGYLVMRDGADGVVEPAWSTRSFRAIGTTATVVVQDPADADAAERLLAAELPPSTSPAAGSGTTRSCSRCTPRRAGPWLSASCCSTPSRSRCEAAQRTGGAVDPTVGNAIAALGYDADLDEVRSRPPGPPRALGVWPGISTCSSTRADRTVRIPRGVRLDLGSTAKALAADRAAARIADRRGGRAREPRRRRRRRRSRRRPAGGPIGIARESSTPPTQVDQVVAITRGGLASSGTSVRTWRAGGP